MRSGMQPGLGRMSPTEARLEVVAAALRALAAELPDAAAAAAAERLRTSIGATLERVSPLFPHRNDCGARGRR